MIAAVTIVVPTARSSPILKVDESMIVSSVKSWGGVNRNAHGAAPRRFAVNGGREATTGAYVRRTASGWRVEGSQQCVLVATTDLQPQSVIQYRVVIAVGVRGQLTYASHADQR